MCPAFIYTVPIGLIEATTNQQVGLNVITELIIGYALPGHPIAMMLFKTWGYNTMSQAVEFTSNFKLGHYMKIPHRPIFWCQIIATVVASTVVRIAQAVGSKTSTMTAPAHHPNANSFVSTSRPCMLPLL